MIVLDARQAGEALGLPPLAGPVEGVTIDSRSVRPGDLFVALRGERFDGHDFVEAALAAGASAAVVERQAWAARVRSGTGTAGGAIPRDARRPRGAADSVVGAAGRGAPEVAAATDTAASTAAQASASGVAPIYQVDDTLAAMGALAREVRRASGALVFAITGSAGKTSTKDFLRAMVSRVRRVVATTGNQNNEVGVPLTLLSITLDTEAVVVEMGMRGKGQIADLCAVAEPDIGIITNVHPVHLELLGSIEAIAEAKAELISGLGPGDVAVVPAGADLLGPHLAAVSCRVVRFGPVSGNDAVEALGRLEERPGEDGRDFVFSWPDGEVRVETVALSRHQVENATAAAAACYAAGLPVAECVAGIADVRFSGGRGDVVELEHLCVIDDTYNANPAAVRAALDDLVRFAAERGGRPVAVLGDMLELGPEERRFHEDTGAYAATVGVKTLWGVGPLSEATVEGYRREMKRLGAPACDWSAGHVHSCEESSTVASGLQRGDVVLFKASRSLHLETMVDGIVDEAGRRGSA